MSHDDPEKPPRGGTSGPDATVRLTPERIPSDPRPTVRVPATSGAGERTAADADDPLVGTLIRDKWRVLKRIGAGSFGTVYKVEDVKGGWVEALKILGVDRLTGSEAEEMRARFLREAQIMKRLGQESPYIVGLATYEEDIEAGLIYFLMEFVEGRSLADVLRAEGPFNAERAIRLAKQVCDALSVAHEGPEPVVHRDLKLENLMLTTDRAGQETIKVLDFGIAKIAEKDADTRLTTVGTLGTPGYAAPEQLRAEGVDGRTDLFAFGVCLYSMLTGRDPWLGHLAYEPTHQIYELMAATDRGEVRPIGEAGAPVPPALATVVMTLLRRDPVDRYQSAAELKHALERAEANVADAGVSSLRVLTAEPGVNVEIRSGRQLLAAGPTPCSADAIPAGRYAVVVRDPRYRESETAVVLEAGAGQEITVATSRRAETARPAVPKPGRWRRRALRIATLLALFAGAGAGLWYAQPLGRTLDRAGLDDLVADGRVTAVWLTEGGAEGGIALLPAEVEAAVPSLARLRSPFFMPLAEDDLPALVSSLSDRGVEVDATYELGRLLGLAVEAQRRLQYFGAQGSDVRSYALRLAELDPESPQAASLLRKVGERMAWDAEAALAEGEAEVAARLMDECLTLVPDHPRCTGIAAAR